MARIPPKPEAPTLTVEQKRLRIERLQNCIRDLEDFDTQKLQKRFGPEVMAFKAAIEEALSAAFGHGTPAYGRYKRAAVLDDGAHVIPMGPTWGRGSQVDFDALKAQEARRYFADGKQQSIALLRQAIRTLEDEIAEQEQLAQPLDKRSAPELSRKVFVVHGHDDGVREAVARFLQQIGFEPIILHEQPNQGRTVIEKVETHGDVGFAVVLLTPDDDGCVKGGTLMPRAR